MRKDLYIYLIYPVPGPSKHGGILWGRAYEKGSWKVHFQFQLITNSDYWLWRPSSKFSPTQYPRKEIFFWQNLLCRHSSNWTNVTRRGIIRQQWVGSDQRDSGTKVEPMSRKSPTAQTNLALFKTSCEKKCKSWKILQFNVIFYNIFAPLQFKARLDERENIWICRSF